MGNNNTARQTGAKGAPAVSATPTAEVEKRAADAGVVSPDRNTPEETPIPEPAPLSPLPEKDAAPAPASSDAEGVPADDSVIVIAAYPGTKDLLQALWQKAAPGHCTLVFVDDAPFAKQFPALIADASIPDEFVFVPANCAPVAPVDFADLAHLKVYVRKDGSRHYAERLPMLLNKVALVELCGTMQEDADNETLVADYAKEYRRGVRATEVSHDFGNFVTLVLRSNPCENVVIAGLCQRKFIAASAEGWNAVSPLLTKIRS